MPAAGKNIFWPAPTGGIFSTGAPAFSWGGVGPILGGGVYFPSRGRVALRASRGGIPPFPPVGLL